MTTICLKDIIKEIPSPEQIKALRKEKKLTQEKLAAIIQQTRTAVVYYEKGLRQMSPGVWRLMKIELGQELPLYLMDERTRVYNAS